MKVYLPATVEMLREFVSTGRFTPIGMTGFALTPALRESYAAGDTEELEYSALLDAARGSIRLLAGEQATAEKVVYRRAIIVADINNVSLRPDLDFSVVKLAEPVNMREVLAVYLDTEAAQDAVRAAVEVIDAADMGDLDAEFILGSAEDHDLAWYATQELGFALELL